MRLYIKVIISTFIQIHKSRFKSKKTLKVFSISSKSDKFLPEECHGNFTTQPYMNRMLISDMIEHVPNPFPCGAVIYLNPEIYQNPATSSKVCVRACACVLMGELVVICGSPSVQLEYCLCLVHVRLRAILTVLSC